ncbi:hypothetical protein EV426DRAFT_722095 [Tirmania nivea]|nr:hypothetical protein EV426DRAFT_722095 [Tirmania nivea]
MDVTKQFPTQEHTCTRLMQYIAAAAATINYANPLPTATEADRRMPTQPKELANGFIAGGGSPGRGVVVMDALASICVSQATGEVFAIGLQFNHKDSILDILIAGNHNKNDSLRNAKQHLENVLRKVKQLGDLYAEERKKDGDPAKWKKWKDNSPPKVSYSEGHRITQCAMELNAIIVKHSAAKLHRRIVKRWTDFIALTFELARHMQSKQNIARLEEEEGEYKKEEEDEHKKEEEDEHKKETQFFENLLLIADCISCIYDVLGKEPRELKPEALNIVCVELSTAWGHFAVLQAAHEHDVFRYVEKFSPRNTFPLMHYLEKVLSIYGYFVTLMNWAHSPRLRMRLSMKTRIQVLAESSKAPNLPTNEAAWEAVLNDLLESANVDPTDQSFVAESAKHAWLRYRPKRPKPKRYPVHCEVALVQYYHQNSSIVPPFNYIGVSKLSCLCCHLFLCEFAKETKKNFKTRGTHSKIYYPWGFPELGTPDGALEGRIQEQLATEIAIHAARQLMKKGKVRSRAASDSSGASVESGQNFQDPQKRPERIIVDVVDKFLAMGGVAQGGGVGRGRDRVGRGGG